MTKKTKKILFIGLGVILAFVGYMRFFRKDKMGGTLSIGSGNVALYNGTPVVGAFIETAKLVGGYWQAQGVTGRFTGVWEYRPNGFVRIDQ